MLFRFGRSPACLRLVSQDGVVVEQPDDDGLFRQRIHLVSCSGLIGGTIIDHGRGGLDLWRFGAISLITQCAAKEILDLHSRRVIGLAVSNRMKRDLAIRGLKMAIALRSPPRGCIFHSDRGSQYCSHDDQKLLRDHGLKTSMSSKGNCFDNAAVLRRQNSPLDCFQILLTFFKTIKAELIWRRPWETRRQAETAIFQCTNAFHDPRRRHSALRGKSPLAFERQVGQTSTGGGTNARQVHPDPQTVEIISVA